MATHSSTLSWRIPWTEEPGGLQLAEGVHMPVATDIAVNQSLSLKEEAITN